MATCNLGDVSHHENQHNKIVRQYHANAHLLSKDKTTWGILWQAYHWKSYESHHATDNHDAGEGWTCLKVQVYYDVAPASTRISPPQGDVVAMVEARKRAIVFRDYLAIAREHVRTEQTQAHHQ